MKQAIQRLQALLTPLYEPREAKAVVRLLLEELCGFSYTQIVMQTAVLSDAQRTQLEACGRLLADGIPVQQVLGYTWFRGRKFRVTADVLIPRPETAELVDMVVDNFVDKRLRNAENPVDNAVKNVVEKPDSPSDNDVENCPNPVDKTIDNSVENPSDKATSSPVENSVENASRVVEKVVENPVDKPVYNLLDVGTGSGCIALSLAADINRSFITAADLSTAALDVAKSNAKALGISNVRFVEADILREEETDFSTELSTLPSEVVNRTAARSNALYDAIVSNPPYICRREAVDMEANVLDHEPHLALFVPNDDPLLFYRAIARYGQRHLRPGGGLYFEINASFGAETCQLLRDLGYTGVTLRKDFDGRDRFVLAQKPHNLITS